MRNLWRSLLVVALVALLFGGGMGFLLYRMVPDGLARWEMVVHHTSPTATVSATPNAAAVPGNADNSWQQFNAAITSYQTQPIDAHTGLRLIIQKLHVNAPIVERGLVQGWMVVAPGNAVTHFIYSAYPGAIGNAILYSHDGTVFRHLDMLTVHDTIIIQAPNGIQQFAVRELRIVAPEDLAVLDATQTATLTLLTCYPYGVDSSRLVVLADLVHD